MVYSNYKSGDANVEHARTTRNADSDDDDEDNSSCSSGSSGSSGSSSSSQGSNRSHGDSSHVSDDDHVGRTDDDRKLVWKESQHVWRSKVLVFCVIIIVAIAGSLATYFLVKKNEENDFRLTFNSYAKEVGDSSEATVVKSFSVVGMLSKSITNVALNTNQTFPFFTHPNFEEIAGEARLISEVDAIALCPLVQFSLEIEWENYTQTHSQWLKQGLIERGLPNVDPGPIPPVHFAQDPANEPPGSVTFPGNFFLPIWQLADAPTNASVINADLFSRSTFQHTAVDVVDGRQAILSDARENSFISQYSVNFNSTAEANAHEFGSYLMQPVYDSFETVARVVGFLVATFPWSTYFNGILIDEIKGIVVVIADRCGTELTYMLDGPVSIFMGIGDLHDPAYDSFRYDVDFASFAKYDGPPHAPYDGESYNQRFNNTPLGHCDYLLSLYPSKAFQGAKNQNAAIYTVGVAAIFATILALLAMYDFMVTRRQNRLMATAKKTDAIVASLFPKEIRNKMMEDAQTEINAAAKRTNNVLNGVQEAGTKIKPANIGKPIADLFPETTIFFADIAGFTAWSSAREPAQVFTLLENIYHAFDAIAESRRVFKVETVGDCYVAVTGLPVPRKDHAVAMCRFARDCLQTFNAAVKEMEMSLGPDTADLGLRVGLHSGPVTAGVLRGERSRFQLFGDTVNTASRMESNGLRDRIHVSQETADILVEANKGHWLTPRSDKINAKGKGELQTYWVEIKSAHVNSSSESVGGTAESTGADDEDDKLVLKQKETMAPVIRPVIDFDDERQQRLIDWNTDCLLRFLKEIEARRKITENEGIEAAKLRELEQVQLDCPLDEVVEIIVLPTWEDKMKIKDIESVDLGNNVTEQLRDYIQTIANMYRKNPFHNFEHASHVAMSVIKLLTRIVAPHLNEHAGMSDVDKLHDLHDHTYGITSDPLIQFACAFSALIHDVDHSGVPNMQLIKEKSKLATVYNNKSIAEQNSVDLAWALLMDESYVDLRRAIYHDETEFKRFRQLVVNSVMATDIMDKDLKTLRNNRWDKAFTEINENEDVYRATNRKATIVIEHLIQASDVAHTMQHWHIYRKWNERFFTEMYKAYVQGRSDSNPVDNWYKGEIGFFDFYIIPLAKKLKDCGVFGVSSDEYLNYAQRNRKEWEAKGQEVVEQMVEKVKQLNFCPPAESSTKGDLVAADTTSNTTGSTSSSMSGSSEPKTTQDADSDRLEL